MKKPKTLSLTETKLKGKEKIPWYGVNGTIASVQEMKRGREGVVILFNDMCQCSDKLWMCCSALPLEFYGLS